MFAGIVQTILENRKAQPGGCAFFLLFAREFSFAATIVARAAIDIPMRQFAADNGFLLCCVR